MDGLKQVSKYMRQIAEKADHVLKRYVPSEPVQERIRDVFDPTRPFVTTIFTPNNEARTTIDLHFGKRLPTLGCCSDCFCGMTEEFSSDSLVSGNIYTSQPYLSGSAVVYINGLMADKGSDFTESNPEAGQISILVPASQIVVSYVYTTDNCTEAICLDDSRWDYCPELTSFIGGTLVFSDRFDRPSGAIPTGGCGVWTTAGVINNPFHDVDPAPIETLNGFANFNNDRVARLGGYGNFVGSTFDILVAFTYSGESAFSLAATGDGYGVSAGWSNTNGGRLSAQCSAEGINTATGSLEGVSVQGATSYSLTTNERYWFRMYQLAGSLNVKLWLQSDAEPLEATVTITAGTPMGTGSSLMLADLRLVQPTISYLTPNSWQQVEAIAVWAGGGLGRMNSIGHHIYDYSGCFPPPDNLTRFQHCDPISYSLTRDSGATSDMEELLPSYEIAMGWPSFTAGDGALISISQRMVAFKVTEGRPHSIKVSGEIRAVTGHSAASGLSMPVQFFQASSDDVEPSWHIYSGIQGTIVGGQSLIFNEWRPFTFTLDATSDTGFVRWGMKLAADPFAYPRTLPPHVAPFLFANNTTASFQLRNVIFEADSSTACSATDICGQCFEVICNDMRGIPEFTGDFHCGSSSLELGNLLWGEVDYGKGMKIESLDNILTFSYRANGITTTGSDGFCIRSVSSNNGTRSLTSANGELILYTSADCNPDWEMYFEVQRNTLPSPWTITGGSGSGTTATPAATFLFGSWFAGPSVEIDISQSSTTMFLGATDNFSGTALTFNALTWYSVRTRYESGLFQVKFWPYGTDEPTSWTTQGTSSVDTEAIALSDSLSNFVEDSYFTKVRNFSIVKI